MRLLSLAILVVGCSEPAVGFSPEEIAWGEIDFHDADPVDCDADGGGCDPKSVRIENQGESELTLSLPSGYDGDHICIDGFPADTPMELGLLNAGSAYTLLVSVCGYLAGERDSEVSGELVVHADKGGPWSLPWSYTPIRDIPLEETGI